MNRFMVSVILAAALASCSVVREEQNTTPQSIGALPTKRLTPLAEFAARSSYQIKNWLAILGQRHAYEIRGNSWFTSSLSGSFAKSRSGQVRGKTHSTFGHFIASSDLGSRVKYDINEDGFFCFHTPNRLVLGIFDGSSKWGSGELATQVGINTMRRHLSNKSLHEALLSVRNELAAYLTAHPNVSRQYSAVAAGIDITGNVAQVSHVGDVRVLHLRNDNLLFHTNDHNDAWYEVMAGRMTPKDYLSPEVNKSAVDRDLSIPKHNDLGAQTVETTQRRLKSGDTMVIASDGVWKVLTIDEVVELTRGRNNKEAAAAIRERVRLGVGSNKEVDDNVTVIVYRHDPEGLL